MRQASGAATLVCSLGLAAALSAAALAFGGTEPIARAAVECALFLLLAVALWSQPAPFHASLFLWLGPAMLAGWIGVDYFFTRPAAYPAREQMLLVAAQLAAFELAVMACRARTARRMLLGSLVSLGLFEAFYGLAQYLTGWQKIFTFQKTDYLANATGTYINPDHFSGLLEMILPFAFVTMLGAVTRLFPPSRSRRSSSHRNRDPLPMLVFGLGATLAVWCGILFSRSRAGIACAAASLLLLGLAWMWTESRSGAAGLVLAGALAMACLAGAWIGLGPVASRYSAMGRDLPSRIGTWKSALELIAAHPIAGEGPGSFADSYTRVQNTLLAASTVHAHNDYLEFAAEWGVTGSALFFGLIAAALIRAFLARRRAKSLADRMFLLGCCGSIAALLLHSLADFNLQIPANALVFAALLGMACTSPEETDRAPSPRRAV